MGGRAVRLGEGGMGNLREQSQCAFYRLTSQGKAQLDSETKKFDQMIRAVQLVLRTV